MERDENKIPIQLHWQSSKQASRQKTHFKKKQTEHKSALISGLAVQSFSDAAALLLSHAPFFQNICSRLCVQIGPNCGENIAGPIASSHKLPSRVTGMCLSHSSSDVVFDPQFCCLLTKRGGRRYLAIFQCGQRPKYCSLGTKT